MKLELSHDILAKKIYDLASTEDKMLIKISKFISNRYKFYVDARVLLDQASLNYIAPYLQFISLEEEQKEFLKKSRRKAKSKQFALKATLIFVFIILFGAGIDAVRTSKHLSKDQAEKAALEKNLKIRQSEREIAEAKAQDLLERSTKLSQVELEKLDSTVKIQLIIQYDTLSKQQTNTRQERDCAQSSTLSDLAEKALDQDDFEYSIKLAIKAWELNPNNEQALEILEELSESEETLEELSKREVKVIANKLRKKYKIGKLKKKDLKAIFTKENTVGQKSNSGVKEKVEDIDVENVEDNEIVTPTIFKNIQQQIHPIEPITDVINKEIIDKLDCALAKKNIGKWKRIIATRRYVLYFKYTADAALHFQLEPFRAKGFSLPTYTSLFFSNKEGKSRRIQIVKKEGAKGKIIYTAKLTEGDKTMLKKEKLSSISFVSPNSKSPHQIRIPSTDQTYFLTFSKCVL